MAKFVCIGGSTGAPAGLVELLKGLPPDFPAPILVALHMPSYVMESYVKSLAHTIPLPAEIVQHDTRPQPGRVYLGPGGSHIGLGPTGRVVVTDKPDNTKFKPRIDILFHTAARALRSNAVAVVLSGLSAFSDAVEGAKAVRGTGGKVLVLDDPANKFLGMPRNVIEAGAATEVLSLADLGKKLGPIVR